MKKFLRLLYQPYKWLIVIPGSMLSTFVWGSLAIVLSVLINPSVASIISGTAWARTNIWLTPVLVRVRGREHIQKGQSYVVVSNHQSQYDIFVLYGWLGLDFKWVMKQELRQFPVLGKACASLGHIFIDRSDRTAAIESINAAKQKIQNGTSVIFFPEGTRSKTGQVGTFKKGAFKMALDLGIPLLPITIAGTRDILPTGTLDIFPGKADLIIHPPVPVEGYTEENLNELILVVRDIICQYNKESR
jgi:1-acyl-sn-glycerol-3-phosphate acyltransferase